MLRRELISDIQTQRAINNLPCAHLAAGLSLLGLRKPMCCSRHLVGEVEGVPTPRSAALRGRLCIRYQRVCHISDDIKRRAVWQAIIATVKLLLGEDVAAEMESTAQRLADELRLMEAEEVEMTPATIRARRETLGLTQEALAQRLSVAKTTVARWELGTMQVAHPAMLRLALDRLAERPR